MIGGLIILILFCMVLYVLFIYTYINPEDSFLFGRRWMFDDDVYVSDNLKNYYKKIAVIGIIFTTISLILGISIIL
ncbi:hypothetical protein [Caminicella sporogenes]|uniref:hypothetical protein n=1 Tax=Caminicella sporogenes TaxID=166485 RepID=UPI0025410F20|nr:hypothetical protein [Caminicella sporogenes]WIF95395.1 hypothetical protein QNI18_01785 [Caminicella sporogenes]